ncbi:hypothetical protein [Cypionkella sp. TWP1-2-1b2]|uniref:hypothetical protein n=1 Tax=Cypionkella sp. TWP1-2-1b2 TaxID=2804675 RepID=UPI003CF7A489
MPQYHVIAVPTAVDGKDHSRIIGKASSEAEAQALCTALGYTVVGDGAETFTVDDAAELFGCPADGLGAIAVTVEH